MRTLLHSILIGLLLLGTACRPACPPRSPCPAATENVDTSPEALRTISAQIATWVAAGEVIGAEFLMIKRGRIILHEVHGWRDRARGLPVTCNTIARIRSMTKPFVGTAILMLAEAGRLAMDDPVSLYLPAFGNQRSAAITIRQLLTHTGGLGQPGFADDLQNYADLREAVDAVGRRGPDDVPGTRFRYSDAGAATLGAIVAAASGRSLEDFIEKRILLPLGMRDTFCDLAAGDARRTRISCTYRRDASGRFVEYWNPLQPQEAPFFRASGGMYSTPADYARFLTLWLREGRGPSGRLLSEASVRAALEPCALATKDSGVSYGMLWSLYPGPAGQAYSFGHSGSDGTLAWVVPSEELIVLYFTQSRGSETRQRLRHLVAGELGLL